MGRIKAKKPSPAMIVAIVALVFAVAGSAVAGVATVSVLNKKEKKQTRKIARNEIKKAAPGLSVANAAQLGGKPAGGYLLAQSRGVALAGAKVGVSGTLITWFNVLGGAPTVSTDCTPGWCITFPGLSNSEQDVVQGTLDGPGEIEVDPTPLDGHGVFVETFNSSGAFAPKEFFVVIYGASSGG